MDHIIEKVKKKSKFLKLLSEYTNKASLATEDGAAPGTLPVQPAAGTQTAAPANPAVKQQQAAQAQAADAAKKAAQTELQALQSTSNVNQERIKQLQAFVNGQGPAPAPVQQGNQPPTT